MTEYLYVFDYRDNSVHRIAITGNRSPTETILKMYGFDPNRCDYMYSTEELKIVN